MRLREVLFTGPAQQQLDDILEESEENFGPAARERYESLVLQALEDLLDNPARPGVRQVAGRLHYHLHHSRTRTPKERGRVGAPRHLIVARVLGEDLLVLAFGHDGMVDALAARIEEGKITNGESTGHRPKAVRAKRPAARIMKQSTKGALRAQTESEEKGREAARATEIHPGRSR